MTIHQDDFGQREVALMDVLRLLRQRAYTFTTPTPATHARVLAHRPPLSRDLRDVFGWSLLFAPTLLDPALFDALVTAEAVSDERDGLLKSRYRISSLGDDLFLHSAYPTDAEQAVFFGPDSYRFAALIRAELERSPPPDKARVVDIGTGAGVGAIVAARRQSGLILTMTDINAQALRLARINAEAAGVKATAVLGPGLTPVRGEIDLALANPPYIMDTEARDYRDGGDMHGGQVSYDMAAETLPRLGPNGRMILYTGSAIVAGHDALREALAGLAEQQRCTMKYREVDPDVFGEELEKPPYHGVERIAVVAAILTRLN